MKKFSFFFCVSLMLLIPIISDAQITIESNSLVLNNGFIYSDNSTTGSFIRFTPNQGIVLQAKNNTFIDFDSSIRFNSNYGIYNGLDKWTISFSEASAYGIDTPIRFFETISFGTLNIGPGDPHITAEDYLELRFNADNDLQSGFKISKGINGNPVGDHIDVLHINSNDDLVVESGDFYAKLHSKGIVLVSPNGNCHRINVTDAGILETAVITCPN